MPAQSPTSIAIALPQRASETAPARESKLSLNRIVAALQVLLATRRATRRAARNEDHAYWYTVARGM
jgi:hypothetical protein